MNNFSICELNNSKYKILIIATTYISPIQTLSDIEAVVEYTGKVLFDLTLINGINSNRFIEAEIYNGIFDRKSFKIVKVIDSDIKAISAKFFYVNKDIVNGGTIPKSLKSLIASGEII